MRREFRRCQLIQWNIVYLMMLCISPFSTTTTTVGKGSEQQCMLHTASTVCQHYHRISELKFHAFIKPKLFNTTCRQSHGALECVDKLLVGCPNVLRTPFTMQRAVLKAVCQDRRNEYFYSAKCFSDGSLQKAIVYTCLSKASNSSKLETDPCSLTREIISCAMGTVRKTNGCDSRMVNLMKFLLHRFLSSLCPKRERQKKITPPPTSTRTSTPTPKRDPSELKSNQREKNSSVSLRQHISCFYVIVFLNIFSRLL